MLLYVHCPQKAQDDHLDFHTAPDRVFEVGGRVFGTCHSDRDVLPASLGRVGVLPTQGRGSVLFDP